MTQMLAALACVSTGDFGRRTPTERGAWEAREPAAWKATLLSARFQRGGSGGFRTCLAWRPRRSADFQICCIAGFQPVVFGMEVEMSDDHQTSQSVLRMERGRGRLPDPVRTKNG